MMIFLFHSDGDENYPLQIWFVSPGPADLFPFILPVSGSKAYNDGRPKVENGREPVAIQGDIQSQGAGSIPEG